MQSRIPRIIGWNLIILFVLIVFFEIVFRIIYFGPQTPSTIGADAPWFLQLPDRFIPDHERRDRLTHTEIDRLPHTSRLDKLYRFSDYKIYGDLEPNRDVLFISNADRPYRVVTNSSGLRRKEQIKTKDENTIRVLCLGDSFTFGVYVPNEDTYPAITEGLLNSSAHDRDFEVLNAGVVGYFLRREKDLYISQARGVKPDIVVLQVLDNDLSGYIKSGYVKSKFPTPESETYPRPPSPEFIRAKSNTLKYKSVALVKTNSDKVGIFYFASRLIDWAYTRINPGKSNKSAEPSNYYVRPTQTRDHIALDIWSSSARSELLIKAKRENEKDFRELVEATAADGVKLLVLYIPTEKTLSMHAEGVDPVDEYYRELADKYQVNYLSLLNSFAADKKPNTLYLWPWNLHLSSFGYYVVARELKQKIIELSAPQ